MIELTVDLSGLTRLERSLAAMSDKQTRYAMAQALNDCTRAASVAVNQAMPEVFDRPTAFTDRGAIAPRDLAATREHLVATVTLRPIQAKYLEAEEQGGTRTPAMNTRKPGAHNLVLPGARMVLDAYGNIPNATLRGYMAQASADRRVRGKLRKAKTKYGPNLPVPTRSGTVFFLPGTAPANQAHISGYFMRLNRMQIGRLTAFKSETHYHARLGYHARVEATFQATWPPAIQRRLLAAFATAR